MREHQGTWFFRNFSSQEDYEEKSYTPVQLFQKLEMNDADWSEVAKRLFDMGYGERGIVEKKSIQVILDEPKPEKAGEFPYHVLPSQLLSIIDEISEKRDDPKDILAFGMLNAFSGAIGLNYELRLVNGWKSTALLYSVAVAEPSVGKSPAIKFIMKPFQDIQGKWAEEYKSEKEKWDADKEKTKKQRVSEGVTLEKEPTCKRSLVKVSTIEALMKVHTQNPKGLFMCADELTSWLQKFNRYSAGGEEKDWIEIWSSNMILNDTISRGLEFIKNTYISVFGGIQPDVLHAMASGGLDVDGFLFRFLFLFSEPRPKKAWNEMGQEVRKGVEEEYHSYLERYIRLPYSGTPTVLNLSHEANEIWGQWYDANNDEIQAFDPKTEKDLISIWVKMSQYCTRLALLVELIWQACENRSSLTVREESMLYGCHLADYFKGTAKMALTTIERNKEKEQEKKTTVSSRIDWRKIFGEDLEVGRGDLIRRIVAEVGLSTRWANNYITKELTQVKRGVYKI